MMHGLWVLLSCALVFATSQAIAQTAQQRVQAFQSTCIDGRASLEDLLELAGASGWTVVERSSHPMLEAALERSSALLPVEYPLFLNRNVDGMSLYMIAGQGTGRASTAVGCYIFDFDSSGREDEGIVEALLGAPPVDRDNLEDVAFLARWGPQGLPEGAVAVGTAFVVPGGAAADALGIAGTMLALISVTR